MPKRSRVVIIMASKCLAAGGWQNSWKDIVNSAGIATDTNWTGICEQSARATYPNWNGIRGQSARIATNPNCNL
jgi:hypothetical protein